MKEGRRTGDLPPHELEELRHRVEAGEPFGDLATEFGIIGHMSIIKYAQKNGWKREWVDLSGMERDYRLGILTNSELARKYSTTRQAVHAFATEGGWRRDLSEEIRAQAEARIRKELAGEVDKQLAEKEGDIFEEALVEANAHVQATITRHHQTGASTARETAIKMMREMGALAIPQDQLERFIEMAADAQTQHIDDFDKQEKARNEAIDTFLKLVGLNSRSGTLKNLMNALAQAIDVERKVYGIKDEQGETDVTKALRELAQNG